jgi:hypothetical protein
MERRRDSTPGGKRGDERPALALPLYPATVTNREAVTRTGEPRDPALDRLRDALLLTIYWGSSSGGSGPQRVFADAQQEARIAQICAAALDPSPAPSILDSSRFPLHWARLRWIAAFSLPRVPDHRGTATDASSLPPAPSRAGGHPHVQAKPPGRRRLHPFCSGPANPRSTGSLCRLRASREPT